MTRALLVLALFAGAAHAERGFPESAITNVTGELRGSTAVFVARYVVQVHGETYAQSTVTMEVPDGAVATSVVVHAPDGRHRLALVDAEQASKSFSAINDTRGRARRWAVLVEARGLTSLDVSIAAPRTATLVVDLEMQMQTCFYRDMRYAEVPTTWKRVLSPQLRRGPNSVGRACRPDGAEDDEHLWIAFPDRARKHVGMNAARIDVGDAHLARLEITLAKKLGDVPHDLATAILVDSSRSMTRGQLDAQRELAMAYARAAGDSRVQVIAYARTARALLPSWTTARSATPRLDRELRSIAPRNGSNIEAGFALAGRMLAQVEGTKRVVLVTDELLSFRMQATIDSLAHLLPANTTVHVVHVGEFGQLARDWHGSGLKLAHGSGGISATSGVPETDPLDVTMLLRPIRIEQVAISAPGWRRFRDTVSTSCEAELDEGHSCVWWGEGDRVAGPVTVDGWLWGKRITRVVTPDAGRHLELARELSTMNIFNDDRTRARVARMARAATTAWSFYAEWGKPGGYQGGFGSLRGGNHFHGRSAHASVGHTVRLGAGPPLPPLDLAPQLAGVIAKCGLGESRIEATVETTGSEIVDVSVIAPPAIASCVDEAIWETSLTLPQPLRHERTRVVLVE